MADQQTPIQGDTQTTPVQTGSQDLLGNISIDLPQAPVEEAATSPAPASDTTNVASISDTLSADLGSITLPETPTANEAAPIEQISIDLPTAPVEPTVVEPMIDAITSVSPQETVVAPVEGNTLESIMAAPLEASVTETPVAVEAAPLTIESAPVLAPIEELPQTISPIEEYTSATPVSEISPANTIEAAAPTSDAMSVNLESLTNDVTPTTPIETPAETTPVTASVTLPEMTVVSGQHPTGSSKKKTLAMAGALIVLLAVGAFVFKTMMPDESSRLYASVLSIFGATPPAQESILKQPETVSTTSGAIDTLIDRETTGSVDTGLAAAVAAIGSGTTNFSGMNTTGTSTPMMSGTTNSGATNNSSTVATLSGTMNTKDAQEALTTINEKSKKSLALAKKNDVKDAADRLYKIFKDSTNLLETLANGADISTIADIEQQINTLQQNLNQAIIILNVTSSSNAQS